MSPPADLSTVAPSPGALFLRSVADDLAERIAYAFADPDLDPASCDLARELEEEVHEVADAAPSVYTFTRWQEFTDLAAWQEDTTELGVTLERAYNLRGARGGGNDDLTGAAGVALYMIAERLARALVEAWAEELAAEVDA